MPPVMLGFGFCGHTPKAGANLGDYATDSEFI